MRFVLAVSLVWGCSGAESDGEVPDDSPPVEGDAPTFVDDVRPLLASSCVRCHGPSLLAPIDFLDYPTVQTWAEVMIDRVEAGTMPPPAADPDCHPYQGDEVMDVDPALVGTLRDWIDGGMLSGDLTQPNEVEAWVPPVLSRHDLELRTAAPYAPQFVDGNEYRCFLLDEIDSDGFVTGIEFLMDRPEVSHHALLFIDPNGGAEQNIQDEASQSWRCASVQPEPNWISLHAWAPSGGAVEFEEGMGLRVRQGQQLVLQMHYFEQGEPGLVDRPGYALKLEPTVAEEMYYMPIGPDGFVVPAGEANHTETIEFPSNYAFGPNELHLYGVMPHMHILGTGYDFHATSAAGEERCISRSDAYDFAMQPTYWFDEPVVVSPTDTVSISCTYDNSAANPRQLSDPPVDVYWGENTQQEMCYALMYGVLR